METTSIKSQIDSLEQQLKVLKSKILHLSTTSKFSALHGACAGKFDLSFDEIKKYHYSLSDSQ
jgi:hypothetical protein